MSAASVTAIVLTRNEQDHLPDCLASLRWADAVLVLDSGSTDNTVGVARALGADVHRHPFTNYARQRQHALGLAETPWVLFVDADERVPPALATEIRQRLDTPAAAGYWIPRQNYFWGCLVHTAGWWPDHQLRLLRVDRVHYDPAQAVHEVATVAGPTARLTVPLIHLNYDSLAEFRAKQAEYARLDAHRRQAEGHHPAAHSFLLQPAREFYRRYVTLAGWRAGGLGLLLCGLMAWYELLTLRELQRLVGAGGTKLS